MDTLQIYFRINLIRDRLEWRILRILPDLRGVEECATDRLHNTLPPILCKEIPWFHGFRGGVSP